MFFNRHVLRSVVILIFILASRIECKRVKRVIGGTEVPCGTQIRIVSLRNRSHFRHLCGATIITPHAALTAAHCVEHDPEQYLLSLDNYCICGNKTTPNIQVLEIIRHPLYNKLSQAHDIAVLRLRQDLNITYADDEILPNSSFGISGECIIYGYGYKDVRFEERSDKLIAATVTLISLDKCSDLLGMYVAPDYNSGMICAMGDGADTCQGDSGGPLICMGKLQGISSYGLSCGVPGIPGVYTSVGSNIQWLQTVLQFIKLTLY